jgi:N-methylhydantoinase B/oxoprolinase/acetone carboxylase alpha subunit
LDDTGAEERLGRVAVITENGGAGNHAADSRSARNSIPFGDGSFGYYETLAGGVGAGPGFHGASAVHTLMTNTCITDPEVLASCYPVRVEGFGIWRGSGWVGRWKGGDGIVRRYRFLREADLSLLTSAASWPPSRFGGGKTGAKGANIREVSFPNPALTRLMKAPARRAQVHRGALRLHPQRAGEEAGEKGGVEDLQGLAQPVGVEEVNRGGEGGCPRSRDHPAGKARR